FAESQANPDLRGMGTTCSAIVIRDGRAWFAHVGDSRIYLMRGGEIRPLTEDHSLVASMVREGLLTPEEAEVHPRRNVLQRSMGVAGDVEVDVSPEMALEPGDLLVLCSDGLYGLVKEKEIGDILSSSRDIDGAADELVQRALDRGAPDNVTVIVSSIDDAIVFLDGDQDAVPVQTAGPELEQEPDRAEARRTSGMLKWLILGLLVFGATGAAILYWSEGTLLSLLQRIGR
ncbi:MAG TPA: protein phosphatase 2C domain-containing protein, partial [Thermoanaerobaculia bacterium]|nr:protein phosphatase 2C domain-containing protein [Thermoanaerobaculia bacterium]